MKLFVFKELSAGWIVVSAVLFVGLLAYSFTGLSYELLFLPLYPLLAVFWIWRKLRERSDAARSKGSR
jgi:hypothetical protein